MASGRRKLVGVVGLMFLALGIFNLLRGENWVVWIILGVLFGGIAGVKSLFGKSEPGA